MRHVRSGAIAAAQSAEEGPDRCKACGPLAKLRAATEQRTAFRHGMPRKDDDITGIACRCRPRPPQNQPVSRRCSGHYSDCSCLFIRSSLRRTRVVSELAAAGQRQVHKCCVQRKSASNISMPCLRNMCGMMKQTTAAHRHATKRAAQDARTTRQAQRLGSTRQCAGIGTVGRAAGRMGWVHWIVQWAPARLVWRSVATMRATQANPSSGEEVRGRDARGTRSIKGAL